jgi:hypothetical protein
MFAAGTAIDSQLPPSTALPEDGELAALVLHAGQALFAAPAEVHGGDQDALAWGESSNVFADLGDLARDVTAEDVRQLHAGQSFANPDVEMIERAGLHADQHFVFARLRIGDVFVGQDFGATELMDADGFHSDVLQWVRRLTAYQGHA